MSRRLFLERVAALIGISIAVPAARAAVIRKVELQRSPRHPEITLQPQPALDILSNSRRCFT